MEGEDRDVPAVIAGLACRFPKSRNIQVKYYELQIVISFRKPKLLCIIYIIILKCAVTAQLINDFVFNT